MLHEAARTGDIGAAKNLVAAGVPVDFQTDDGQTPLYRAIFEGHTGIMRVLLAAGADGEALLHEAVSGGHAGVAEILLAAGVPVDVRTDEGWTSLHVAARAGHADVTDVLLAKDAQIDARTNEGWTSLQIAAGAGHSDVTDVLLAKDAKVTPQTDYEKTSSYESAELSVSTAREPVPCSYCGTGYRFCRSCGDLAYCVNCGKCDTCNYD